MASQTGLDELIQKFLQYTHLDASGVPLFVCCGRERLFKIQDPIYREFLLKFYSTVYFDTRKTPDDRTSFYFRLARVSRECGAIELAVKVRVYTLDETRNVHFLTFLVDFVMGRHVDYNKNVFWGDITGGVYILSTTRGSTIRSTAYGLLHRFTSISLTHHKNSERVCLLVICSSCGRLLHRGGT